MCWYKCDLVWGKKNTREKTFFCDIIWIQQENLFPIIEEDKEPNWSTWTIEREMNKLFVSLLGSLPINRDANLGYNRPREKHRSTNTLIWARVISGHTPHPLNSFSKELISESTQSAEQLRCTGVRIHYCKGVLGSVFFNPLKPMWLVISLCTPVGFRFFDVLVFSWF